MTGTSFDWILALYLAGKAVPVELPNWNLARHACVLEGPVLQTGASVSAGAGGKSTATVLFEAAKAKGAKTGGFKSIAHSGDDSKEQFDLAMPIIKSNGDKIKTIFAIDLFYWDNKDLGCKGSAERARKLVADAQKWKKNLIVGNVPVNKENQACAKAINAELKACSPAESCYLLDLNSMHAQLMRDRSYTFDGKVYEWGMIMVDGVHLSEAANTILAEQLMRQMDAFKPACEQSAVEEPAETDSDT